jgi:energy-converting hydrogenase Eha subunit B
MTDATEGKKGVEAEREPNFLAIATAAIVTIPEGTVLWTIFVFMTLVLCERSAAGAMLVLGFLGIITVFMVLALFSLPLRQGLLHYATQTLNGFIHSAAGRLQLRQSDCEALLAEVSLA